MTDANSNPKTLRQSIRQVIVDHTHLDHENCSDDCSKKYYEQKNIDDQTEAILAEARKALPKRKINTAGDAGIWQRNEGWNAYEAKAREALE